MFYRYHSYRRPHHYTRWETIKEWAHCLVSKEHARHTWLRITLDDELKALTWINYVICFIAGMTLVMGIIAASRTYTYLRIKHDTQLIDKFCKVYICVDPTKIKVTPKPTQTLIMPKVQEPSNTIPTKETLKA